MWPCLSFSKSVFLFCLLCTNQTQSCEPQIDQSQWDGENNKWIDVHCLKNSFFLTTRSAWQWQRQSGRLLSRLIKGQLVFRTKTAVAKVSACMDWMAIAQLTRHYYCGLWVTTNKISSIICECGYIPLGGAGVEGGAWPKDGRVVLTYWWSLSRSNFLFTWRHTGGCRKKKYQEPTIIISHIFFKVCTNHVFKRKAMKETPLLNDKQVCFKATGGGT